MRNIIGAIGDLTVDTILPGLSTIPDWGQEIEINDPCVRLGGNIGNMAVGASALGTDYKIFATIGDDAEGRYILNELQKMKLDLDGVKKTSQINTSKTYACVRDDGERFMLTYKGTLELIESTMLQNCIPFTQVIFIGGWCLPPRVNVDKSVAQMDRWHREGRVIATDLIWSDETWTERNSLLKFINKVDVLFMNEAELIALTDKSDLLEAVETLQKLLSTEYRSRDSMCIIKLGSHGAALISQKGRFKVDAYPSTPIDTVGAGDLFNIGFLHAMYQLNMDEEKALDFASTFASIFISRYNSNPPSQNEVLNLMKHEVKII